MAPGEGGMGEAPPAFPLMPQSYQPPTGVWKCFSILDAEYPAVRREVGLRSEMNMLCLLE